METRGTTVAELETMEAIKALSRTAIGIKKELEKQNLLFEKLVESLQENRKES